MSRPGLGYEWNSYVWRGSGTWAQLWGMWALPFAWGLGWRAVAKGKQLWLAALVVALTVVVHLLTGYLALLSLGVFVLADPRQLLRRLGRAALVGVGALAASAWMLVPLIAGAKWTINDELSRGTYFYDSFGARRVMGWLVTGRIFDDGRLPVVTLLVAAGFGLCVWTFRAREPARVVLLLGLLSLLLFFGRPTLGPVLDVLPGGGDLFLRRYIMGVHLAGIYLAGLGLTWLGSLLVARIPTWSFGRRIAAVAAVAALILAPAFVDRVDYIAKDWTWIPRQIRAQQRDGADYAALVRRAQAIGPGRIFSELRSARPRYYLGGVPAFAALLNLQADAVGFTRPTWSLASGAEARFDVANPTDPALFGVRYLIFPKGWVAPAGAERVASSGRHVLYEIPHVGYAALVDTIAPIAVDRDDLGSRMGSFLDSRLPARGYIPTLAFGSVRPTEPTLRPNDEPMRPPGEIVASSADPANGIYGAEVQARRTSVVLFKVSFDPGFRAEVDGRTAPTEMLAPALVGVRVTRGRHRVIITYRPYAWYLPLLGGGFLVLIGSWAWERRARPRGGVHSLPRTM